MGGIVHQHSVFVGQRIDFLHVFPAERPLGTVGDRNAASAELWVVPAAECVVEDIAAVNILDVRCPYACVVNPLWTVHSAEGVAHQFPVHHIGRFVNR